MPPCAPCVLQALLEDVTISCQQLGLGHVLAISQLSQLRRLYLKDTHGTWVSQLLQHQQQSQGAVTPASGPQQGATGLSQLPASDEGASNSSSVPNWSPATHPAAALTRLTHLTLDTPGLKQGLPWAPTAPQLQKLELAGYLTPGLPVAPGQRETSWGVGDLSHLADLRVLALQMKVGPPCLTPTQPYSLLPQSLPMPHKTSAGLTAVPGSNNVVSQLAYMLGPLLVLSTVPYGCNTCAQLSNSSMVHKHTIQSPAHYHLCPASLVFQSSGRLMHLPTKPHV